MQIISETQESGILCLLLPDSHLFPEVLNLFQSWITLMSRLVSFHFIKDNLATESRKTQWMPGVGRWQLQQGRIYFQWLKSDMGYRGRLEWVKLSLCDTIWNKILSIRTWNDFMQKQNFRTVCVYSKCQGHC